MKYSLTFFYLVLMWEISLCTSWRFTGKYRLSAVSPLMENEFYFEIRNRNSDIHLQTDIHIKIRICYHVISNKLFGTVKEIPVYPDEVYAELRFANPDIYNDLYELSSEDSMKTKIYMNRSKPRRVFIGENEEAITENLFTCLSHHKRRKKIFQYFISREYNVSDEFSPPDNYIAGRFIYAKDEQGDIRLLALAEEAARILVSPDCDIERYYLELRKGNSPVTKPSKDPLCTLNAYQRSRICSQIFNAYNFEREVSFEPIPENVYDNCKLQQISFYKDDVRREADGFIYKEWMIGCKVERVFTEYALIYWLSRAYKSNELFVYKHDFRNGELIIDNLSMNVRLVYDETDSEVVNHCT